MTESGQPRHLQDLTAEMPAIPREPRHAAPSTGEVPVNPWGHTQYVPRINADRTQYPPAPERRPQRSAHRSEHWVRRAWRWLMGA